MQEFEGELDVEQEDGNGEHGKGSGGGEYGPAGGDAVVEDYAEGQGGGDEEHEGRFRRHGEEAGAGEESGEVADERSLGLHKLIRIALKRDDYIVGHDA